MARVKRLVGVALFLTAWAASAPALATRPAAAQATPAPAPSAATSSAAPATHAAPPLPEHAAVREGAIARAELAAGGTRRSVSWSDLASLHVDPGAATLTLSVPGDRDAVQVPPCAGRGAVTLDGHVYAPPPGPFVIRLTHQASPHTLTLALRVSRYEHRVACGEPVRAGKMVQKRDGFVTLRFSSPARRGGIAVLYVPPGHDVRRPGVLLVGLHPWNGGVWTYAAYAQLLGAAREHDVVLLFPSGLGNSLYVAAADHEVLRALDATERAVAIDPRRVSVWGASMGGAGATTIAFHHPDRFAFVASFFGDSRYDLSTYVRAILHDQAGAHAVNALDVVDNARHLHVMLVHGEADKVSPIAQSKMLADGLRAHHDSVRTSWVPGRGHEGSLAERATPAVVQFAASYRGGGRPARVTYRTVRAEDTGAYGVRLVRAHPGDAFVDVGFESGKVVVFAAENVREIVLAPGALHGAPRGAPVEIRPRGVKLTLRWR